MNAGAGARKNTPRGNMTRGANSGPAVMLMPPHIRATFMPNPPLAHRTPVHHKRRQPAISAITLVSKTIQSALNELQKTKTNDESTTAPTKEQKRIEKQRHHQKELEPKIETYRREQKESGGEYKGMNCYNTLFVGRLAYEVTARKLLREMEFFGPVKDLHIVVDPQTGKSKGYAFVEYEHEEDMKRAYRAADGMKLEGRPIVVDVERGHTVPSWLPRRLGGGLGGTRLGGREVNVTRPGRYDPSRPETSSAASSTNMTMVGGPLPSQMMGGMGRGSGGPPPLTPPQMPMQQPPPHYGGYGHDGPGYGRDGPPPPYNRGGPPPQSDRGRSDSGRKRYRSKSPDRGSDRDAYRSRGSSNRRH